MNLNMKFMYEARQNIKWSLSVFFFIVVVILVTIPPYVWLDLDWLLYIPPIIFIYQLGGALLMCLFIGTLLRFLYLIYKGKIRLF